MLIAERKTLGKNPGSHPGPIMPEGMKIPAEELRDRLVSFEKSFREKVFLRVSQSEGRLCFAGRFQYQLVKVFVTAHHFVEDRYIAFGDRGGESNEISGYILGALSQSRFVGELSRFLQHGV